MEILNLNSIFTTIIIIEVAKRLIFYLDNFLSLYLQTISF